MITSIYQCGVSLYYTLINNNGLWTLDKYIGKMSGCHVSIITYPNRG